MNSAQNLGQAPQNVASGQVASGRSFTVCLQNILLES